MALLAVLCGCSTVASFTAEKFGQAKRATLARRLDKACEAQRQLQESFQGAREPFEALVKFAGEDRPQQAERMTAALARCEARAKAVPTRIAAVERAGQDLFRTWKAASEKHPNEMYRRDRGAKRHIAQRDFNRLMAVLRSTESKIESTLSSFRNQVAAVQSVFLDPSFHLDGDLGASAQAALQADSAKLAVQLDYLTQQLSDSIAAANRFIQKIAD